MAQNAMRDAGLPPITWEVADSFVRAVVAVRQ